MAEIKITLCSKCAAIMSSAFLVKRISTGIGKKVDCSQCKRHRYGWEYIVRKKGERETDSKV